MATIKSKSDLKDVFNGIASLFYSPTKYDLNKTASAENVEFSLDLPVTVDSLSFSQDDPTINHYKVHGLSADWTSSAEAGDFSIEFTVPSISYDILAAAFGSKHVTQNVLVKTNETGTPTYKGTGVLMDMSKIEGTIGILSDDKKNLLLITNIALYATPQYENASTEPFAFKFSGSLESGSGNNVAWLTLQGA